MSVERYDSQLSDSEMLERPKGAWVSFEDYQSLRSELVEARARLVESQAREAELREALEGIRPFAEDMIIDIAADVEAGGNGNGLNEWNAVLSALSTSGPSLAKIRAGELKSLLDEMHQDLRPWIATASEDYQNGLNFALAHIEDRIVRFNDQAARLRDEQEGGS